MASKHSSQTNVYNLPDDAIVKIIQYLDFRQQFRLTMLNSAMRFRMVIPLNILTTKLCLSQIFNRQFFNIVSTLKEAENQEFAENVLRNLLNYCGLNLTDLTVEVVSSSKQVFNVNFFTILADYCPNLSAVRFSMVHGLSLDGWYELGQLENIKELTVGKLVNCNSHALLTSLVHLRHLEKLNISAPRSKDVTWLSALQGCPIKEFRIGGTIDPADPIRDFLLSISDTLVKLSLEIGWWTCADYEWMGQLCEELPNLRSLSVNYRTTVRTGAIYSSPRFATAFLENFKCKPGIRELFLGKGFARPDYVSAVGQCLMELESLHLVITAGSWESHVAFMELKRLPKITTLILEGYKVDESIIVLILEDILPNLRRFKLKGHSNATPAVMDSLAQMPVLETAQVALHCGSEQDVIDILHRFCTVRKSMLNLLSSPHCNVKYPVVPLPSYKVSIELSCFANWDVNRPLSIDAVSGEIGPISVKPVKDKPGHFRIIADCSLLYSVC